MIKLFVAPSRRGEVTLRANRESWTAMTNRIPLRDSSNMKIRSRLAESKEEILSISFPPEVARNLVKLSQS